LAYAARKTTELGITNIDYLQADILELNQLKQEFDVIECSGVLHHMDDPMAGWRILVGLLKTGGLMKIGLYSELARRHILKPRERTASLGTATSQADIRKFRQEIVESREEHHKQISMSLDFFSLSMLRDLMFHKQEHRFTLPQIQSCLGQLGLLFCGFEQRDLVTNFKKYLGEERDHYDLSLWHQFEESHPHTFMGMYQFWCQRI
jgi:SAM-dependent methyltransferase